MNKLRYRIVFNQARGMCMVVAETARSQSKGPGQGLAAMPAPGVMRLPALRRMALLIGIGFSGVLLGDGALAQIVADPNAPGQQRATVLNAANGVPQVNIQTPSAAGVSRNVYSQFDVPKSGAILNNSRTNVQTQLGGWVQGNPWLGNGTARVILNEVRSSNPSRLQGYIEVAGDRAETIIANPAGIVVDGGGFINVSRATLTTGSPVFEDGRLKGYSVQRGQIVVDGAGLDASRTDYAALIARSLQVNAGLWAQRLDVITGVNDVAASAQATVTQTRQASDAAPLYAVDVAQLGGMYANQIYLVGTEAGVGVRNAGAIGAAAGDLVVTASGRLENSGSLSADQRLQTSAIGIDNQGSMQAGQTLALTAGSLVNAGQLASGKEALIVVQGEVDNNGGRIEAQRIDLTGDTLRNARGSIVQAGAQGFAIEATGVANNTGVLGKQSVPAAADAGGSAGADNGVSAPADTVASGNIGNSGNGAGQDGPAAGTGQPSTPMPALADGRLQVRLLDNASGAITANGETVLRAGTLENRGGQMLVSSLSVSGPDVDNTGGVLTILRSFDVHTQRFINDQGRLLVGAAFDGALGAFSNRQGLLQATRLSVDVAEQLDNSGGTLRQLGATQALLTVGGEMALDNGTLDMGGALHLRTGTLSGSGSTLNVTGDLSFDSGAASSAQGRWTIGGNADLRTGALDNSGGAISAARALNITGGLLANTGGTIASGIDAVVRAHGDVENSGGTIQAARDLVLEASGQIQNRAGSIGTLDSGSSLTITGAAIDNGDGRIANAGSGRTTLAAGSIANRGLIGGNGEMGIAAHVLRNDAGGSITSQGGLELALDAVLANAGRIEAGGRLQMNQATAQLNNSGKLVAQGDVTITATSVDNSAGTIATAAGSGNALSLTAGSLVNRAGTIQADGTAQLAVRGDVVNEAGRIRASIGLLLDAGGRIENRNGGIESAAGMLLHGAEIGNDGGTIAASGLEASVVEADRSIDNNGLIGVNGQLTLKARTLASGAAGVINAGGDLELAVSGTLVNRGGSIGTAGTLNFDQAQATLLNSGALTAGMGLRLNLDQVDNRGGALNSVQGSGLDLTTNALDNRGGRLMADGDVAVQVRGAADNGGGVLQAAGSLDARIDGALRNQAGVIEALGVHGTLDLRAAGIDNADGRIAGVGDGATNISAAGHIASSGLIAGNGQLNIVATSLETTGVISAGAGIELAVSRAVDNAGTISAAAMLHMDQAQAGLCNSGTLVAGGPLALSVAALENAGGRIATARGSNANILVSAHAIGNQDGAIVADRDATLAVVDGIDGRGGLLQARGQLQLDAGGVVDVSGGGIETLSADSTLQLHAGALLNEAGRIVNAGGGDTRVQANTMLVNSGELSGNGALHVDAQSVVNKAGGNMVAGSELALHAQALLDNTGTISSGAGLSLDAADAALVNHGTIAANADIAIRAGAVDNDGGTVATASGSGAGVTLQAASLSNRSGSIVAERGLALGVDAALDNSQGRLGGVTTVQVTTGATLSNDGGVIEASGTDATLALRADAIDNGSGRIVNVGRGRTDVSAAGRLTSDGLVAGNGALDLQAATLVNGRSGTLASGQAMTTTFSTRFENAGSVNSGSTLDLAARTAEVRNSGLIVANGALTLASDVFDNAGGQLATARGSGAGLALDAANIVNRGGSILSDRDAQLHSAGGFDNAQGTLQAAGSLRLSAAASVENDGGAIEALDPAATLVVQAGALDNGSGRIVNTGSNATSVSVAGGFVNRGLVAGNGNLALAFGMLDNQAGGSIASGGSLRIDAGHSIANAGAISSQDALTLDAAAATVANHGSVASGSDVTLHARAVQCGRNGCGGRRRAHRRRRGVR